MALDHWLAFVAATEIMLLIPGPTVLLVVSYALAHGRRSAGAMVLGVALGDLTAMTASMLGLGMLLATSAELFTALRWIGAAYLLYLGVKLWRAPVAMAESAEVAEAETDRSPWRMGLHAYAVTALNPKGILFFVAFVPQFFVHDHPFWSQAALFEATFVILAMLNTVMYAALATVARANLRKPSVRRAINRAGGSLLVGAGVAAALTRAS